MGVGRQEYRTMQSPLGVFLIGKDWHGVTEQERRITPPCHKVNEMNSIDYQ